jgi:hypothetical protein
MPRSRIVACDQDITRIKSTERISARARDETEGHEALQLRALELMGKHHKLFTERHEHDLGMGIAERLDAALKRIGDKPDVEPKRAHRSRHAHRDAPRTDERRTRPGSVGLMS